MSTQETASDLLLDMLLGPPPYGGPPQNGARPAPPRREDAAPKALSAADLIRRIEENHGPAGLDLSGADLSGLDLSSARVNDLLEAWFAQGHTRLPVWASEAKKTSPSGAAFWRLDLTDPAGGRLKPKEIARRFRYGINLQGVDLSGANLRGASLERADLTGATLVQAALQGANLWASVLDGANLWSANLKGAFLARASLAGATLSNANLVGADLAQTDLHGSNLFGAHLADVTFFGADLTGADLGRTNLFASSFWKANLEGARIDPDILSARLLQEDAAALRAHLDRHMGTQPNSQRLPRVLARRYREARDCYLALKANFLSTGNNAAASLAHFRARQAEKKTHHPRWARHCYQAEYEAAAGRVARARFHVAHGARWLLAWGAELTCGYGERPLRVAAVSAAVVACFTALFRASQGIVSTAGAPVTWLSYFQYSLATFCTISFPNLAPANDLAMILSSVEAFLGISCLALLMFALGNRISRS